MRKSMILMLVLLVSAWAVAQQEPTHPNAGSSQSQAQSHDQQNSGAAGQSSATPDAPAASQRAGNDVIEGCLGGSNGNYTVTDKGGTSYALLIPEGADASPLQKHIGESVAVQGTVDNSGSSSSSSGSSGAVGAQAGSGGSQASSANGHAIHAMRIGRGTGQCPASGSSSGSGSSTTPPKK